MDPVFDRLAEPFDPAEVKYKPAVVSGNRALALFYVDARVIQDRLDDVLGPAGWQDDYEICANTTNVVCRLRVLVDGQWITKVDVGSISEQPDAGDRLKAAFSDALKRAAVKFGIGRYLYRLPSQWLDYDPVSKKFLKTPVLPAWACPKGVGKPELKPQRAAPVKPAGPRAEPAEDLVTKARLILEEGALNGLDGLALAWKTLSPDMRAAGLKEKDQLKKLLTAQKREQDKAKAALGGLS